jgi:hypothetical protein
MGSTSFKLRSAVGGVSAVGILAAHWLAYFIAVPDAHDRAHLLQSSGHRFFPWISAVCFGVLAAGLVGLFTRARDHIDGRVRFLPTLLSVAIIQTIGFIGLEVLERVLFAHGSASAISLETPVIIGLLLQVFVSAAGAALLVVFTKAICYLSRVTRSLAKPSPTRWGPSPLFSPRISVSASGWSLRGPPSSF